MNQYDFHKATIKVDGDTVHVDNPNGFSKHQLPDLIRVLQQINAENHREMTQRLIDDMQQSLRGKKGPSLTPIKGDGPKGAA